MLVSRSSISPADRARVLGEIERGDLTRQMESGAPHAAPTSSDS